MPLTSDPAGARLACRVTPKSSRNAVDGLYVAADDKVWVKARVTAAPEKGKANKALIKLIATETGLAPSTMSVISGAHARTKVILIKGEQASLMANLQARS